MALQIIIYSLVIAVLLYLTAVFLPKFMNINENVSGFLFFIITAILFSESKNKWWVNLAALLLGAVVFVVIIILFVP